MDRRSLLRLTGAVPLLGAVAPLPADAAVEPGRTIHPLDPRGTVRDWLVTRAWEEPAADLAEFVAPTGDPWTADGRWLLTYGLPALGLKRRVYQAHRLPGQPPVEPPVEGGAVHWLGQQAHWERARTSEDGFVDWTAFRRTPMYRTGLAAVGLLAERAGDHRLRIGAIQPTVVFLNGELVSDDPTVSYLEPFERVVEVRLAAGVNTLLVGSWQAAFREARHALRVRVEGAGVRAVVASPGADEEVAAAQERVLAAVGSVRWAGTDGRLALTGPAGARLRISVAGRAEQAVELGTGVTEVPFPAGSPNGEVNLRVRPDVAGAPLLRDLPVAVLGQPHSSAPTGGPDQWRDQALRFLAAESGVSHASELARLALGATSIRAEALHGPLAQFRTRGDCADIDLLAVLLLLHRAAPAAWPDGLREQVVQAVAGMKYWIEEPGLDVMCYFTENHQLCWHVAELLSGELLPDQVFANNGWTGRRHAAHGAALAREWILARLRGGLVEFDSSAYLSVNALALVTLVELSTDQPLVAAAEALLDKLLFGLAVNSWRGVNGGASGRSYSDQNRSARIEEVSPILRLYWGMGSYNASTLPLAALATARRYRLPAAIRQAGLQTPEPWWGTQHLSGRLRFRRDLQDRSWQLHTALWKTPDGMLSSVQDGYPGEAGLQEQVWSAVLGPEARVFANHPANTSNDLSVRPNTWMGNRVLPRVRQDRDALVALYRVADTDPLGYTHAWFPVGQFDEWARAGDWTVARAGTGYVALWCAGGADLVAAGPYARQELRPRRVGPAWVCQLGRAADHGSFADFRAALSTPRYTAAGQRVSYRTPDGRLLELGWSTRFRVDGRERPLATDLRTANPYCRLSADEKVMSIRVGDLSHAIDLERGRRV